MLLHTGPDAFIGGPRTALVRVAHHVQHISGSARPPIDRIHSADLRHPLAVSLLSRGEPRLELVRLLLGSEPSGVTQVLVAHDDAFGVRAEHQKRLRRVSLALPPLIEAIEIAGGTNGEFLDLALRDRSSTPVADQLNDFIEGRPRNLLRDQVPHAEREVVGREVQRCVHHVQVRVANRLVAQSGYGNQPDD